MEPIKKILILASNPKNTERIHLDQEMRKIRERLNRARYREYFDMEPLVAVTYTDLSLALLENKPQIVHFIGHGDSRGLMLCDETGNSDMITNETLNELFKLLADRIECVILGSCYSQPQTEIISQHIRYVLGTWDQLPGDAAIVFSVGFYDALGTGESYDRAFEFGRIAVRHAFPDMPLHYMFLLKKKDIIDYNMVSITVYLKTINRTINQILPLEKKTSAVKRDLISQLRLPILFDDGNPISYRLLIRKKNSYQPLEENKTLAENGVRNNDTFVFAVEADDM